MAGIPHRSRLKWSELTAVLFVILFLAMILDPFAATIPVGGPLAIIARTNLMALRSAGRRRPRSPDLIWMNVRTPIDPVPMPLGVVDEHRVRPPHDSIATPTPRPECRSNPDTKTKGNAPRHDKAGSR